MDKISVPSVLTAASFPIVIKPGFVPLFEVTFLYDIVEQFTLWKPIAEPRGESEPVILLET